MIILNKNKKDCNNIKETKKNNIKTKKIVYILFKIISVLFFCYLSLLLVLYSIQRRMLYYPEPLSNTAPKFWHLPEAKPINISTKDGLHLLAWYSPPNLHNKPTIIYFHGNAGNIGHRGKRLHYLLEEGFGLLLLSYRGYGNNPGNPSENGLYEDARAAIYFIQSEKIPSQKIVLFGESLGTGVAVQMAIEYQVGALILQSPYTSMGDTASFHYAYFPFLKYLIKDKFNSIEKIQKILIPMLIYHGEKDDIVPFWMAKALYDKANTVKTLLLIPEASHHDLCSPMVKQYIVNFINNEIY